MAQPGDITLQDPAQLQKFADAVGEIIKAIAGSPPAPSAQPGQQSTPPTVQLPAEVAFPPVKMGQKNGQISDPDYLMSDFRNSMSDIGGNLQTLVNKLTLLASVASQIAKSYTSAAALEQLSAADVRSYLGTS